MFNYFKFYNIFFYMLIIMMSFLVDDLFVNYLINYNMLIFNMKIININFLLLNILNAFHPLFLYLSIVFFFNIYFTIIYSKFIYTNFYFIINKIYKTFFQFNLICFYCNIFALFLGSWWAFQENSWGGWWNWDFSEVLGLLISFFNLSLYHYFFLKKNNINYFFYMKIWIIFFLISYFLVQLGFEFTAHNFGIKFFYFYNNIFFLIEIFIILIFLFIWLIVKYTFYLLNILFYKLYFNYKKVYQYFKAITLNFLLQVFLIFSLIYLFSCSTLFNFFLWKFFLWKFIFFDVTLLIIFFICIVSIFFLQNPIRYLSIFLIDTLIIVIILLKIFTKKFKVFSFIHFSMFLFLIFSFLSSNLNLYFLNIYSKTNAIWLNEYFYFINQFFLLIFNNFFCFIGISSLDLSQYFITDYDTNLKNLNFLNFLINLKLCSATFLINLLSFINLFTTEFNWINLILMGFICINYFFYYWLIKNNLIN